jgi:cytochrome c-type biogenesis protein CcmH/NrfG
LQLVGSGFGNSTSLGATMNELVEIAIVAYRAGRYRDTVELLLQVLDCDASHWLARLYLGMAYEKTGRISDAHRLFKRLADECPDEHVRAKALNAMPLIEAEMKRRFRKQYAIPNAATGEGDGEQLVWIANEKY